MWHVFEKTKKQINKKYNSHVTLIHASTMYMGLPASVVQLDVRPTGEQEVAGLTRPGRQLSFVKILSWNIFYRHSLTSADSRRAFVSFWRKNEHNTG